jgi:hypothetical protein
MSLGHRSSFAIAGALALAVFAPACAGSPPAAQDAPPQSRISAGANGTAAAAGSIAAAGEDAAAPAQARASAATAPVGGAPVNSGTSGIGAGGTSAAGAPPGGSSRTGATSGGVSATGSQPNAAAAGDTVGVAAGTPTISIPANETIVPLATPTRTPTATPQPTATPLPGGQPTIGGCPVFPADNAWNQDISAMPVDANSATYITNIGGGNLHPDFGGGGQYGIPYIVVPQSQPMTAINFTAYGDESDPGPYPIPLNAPVEGGASSTGDRHVLAVQQGTCKLYEMFSAYPGTGVWNAGSGAVFDLRSNALRPDTWTSADAAGLPITAGLIRYDEVTAGQINHAIRFTVNTVRKAWVHPATHYGTSTSTTRIPYGAKLRLKASYDISSFQGEARVILTALKKYGMIVADQGSSWFITGDGDPRWDDNDLNQLKTVPGSMFEVVQLGPIFTYP